MHYIFSRLSQRIRGIGVTFVTFFAFMPVWACAAPGLIDGDDTTPATTLADIGAASAPARPRAS